MQEIKDVTDKMIKIITEIDADYSNAQYFYYNPEENSYHIGGTWYCQDRYSCYYFTEDVPANKRQVGDGDKYFYYYDNKAFQKIKEVFQKCLAMQEQKKN